MKPTTRRPRRAGAHRQGRRLVVFLALVFTAIWSGPRDESTSESREVRIDSSSVVDFEDVVCPVLGGISEYPIGRRVGEYHYIADNRCDSIDIRKVRWAARHAQLGSEVRFHPPFGHIVDLRIPMTDDAPQWIVLAATEDGSDGRLFLLEDVSDSPAIELRSRDLLGDEAATVLGHATTVSVPTAIGSSKGWAVLEHRNDTIIELRCSEEDGLPTSLGRVIASVDEFEGIKAARRLSWGGENGRRRWILSPLLADFSMTGDWTAILSDPDGEARADLLEFSYYVEGRGWVDDR